MAQLLRFVLPDRRSSSLHPSRVTFESITEDLRVLARHRPAALDFVAQIVHEIVLDTQRLKMPKVDES